MKNLNEDYLIQKNLTEFGIDNFHQEIKLKIINGLLKKVKDGLGDGDENNIGSFFEKVIFVQDTKKISDYIKKITKFKHYIFWMLYLYLISLN